MATKPSNQTSSSPSLPSKKELSSIVSNLLAEQQKLSKRIEALEKNVVSHSAQPPAAPAPEIKVNLTEEDINEGFVRFFKNNKLRLSHQTIELMVPRVTKNFFAKFKEIATSHVYMMDKLWHRDIVLSNGIKDLKQRIENLETAEAERVKREEEERVKKEEAERVKMEEERARKWKSLRLNPIVNSVTSTVKHAYKYIVNHLHSFWHNIILNKELWKMILFLLLFGVFVVSVEYILITIITWLFPNVK